MRNEKACLTVAHGFTNARRVRRDDGCPAGRRLEIGDSPSFLRRREHERPGPAKKRQLLRLVDTSKKPYARAATPTFAYLGRLKKYKGVHLVIRAFAAMNHPLSLIHISEPTRRTPISYAVFCLK